MENKVLGKVIRILNSTSLVIDIGNDKISRGDYINVLGKSIDIYDPTTNHKLGEYSYKKAELKISETYDNFSIAEAHKTEKIESSMAVAMNPLLNIGRRTIPLEVNEDQNDNLTFENKVINIGDKVNLVN